LVIETTHAVVKEAINMEEGFEVVATEALSFSAMVDPDGVVGGSGDEELIVYNGYDQLGRLELKKVGGMADLNEVGNSPGLQQVDFDYNIRGWLTAINGGAATGKDLFGFGINYESPTEGLGAVGLYNGNISETVWETANDHVRRAYGYQYDALNRITRALSDDGRFDLGTTAQPVTYDKNGNIGRLVRKGHVVADPIYTTPSHYGTMDDLTYSYDSGNKLLGVTDAIITPALMKGEFKDGNKIGNDYSYDANGNMVSDANKNIVGIGYNHLNLPTNITIGGSSPGTIAYIYDAIGTKLRKQVSTGTTSEYAGNYIYENGQLQFFSHPEGYISAENGTYKYVYQYRDHLGNIRLSYSDTDESGDITVSQDPLLTEIVEENNYYPFGLKHKGYNSGIAPLGNPVAQRYKFGGNELDESFNGTLNTYDFGARNYDPALGRWMNIDPMTEDYNNLSPFIYAANNPIFYSDPDGQRIAIYGNENYRNQVLFQLALLAASSATGNDLIMNAIDSKRTLVIANIEGELGNNTFDGVGGVNLEGGYNVVGYKVDGEGFLDSNNGRNGKELYKNSSTTLAHELGHFESITKGNGKGLLLDDQGRASYDRSDEVYAVERENTVRKELGFDERTHYGGREVYRKQAQRTEYPGYYKLVNKKDYAIQSQNQQAHSLNAGTTSRQIYYGARTKDYRGGYSHFGSEISNRAKKPAPGKQLILDGSKN
jgi:RHS repeat-associated protein